MALTKEKAEEAGKLIPKRIRTRLDAAFGALAATHETNISEVQRPKLIKQVAQQKKDVLDYIAELLAHDHRNPANGV